MLQDHPGVNNLCFISLKITIMIKLPGTVHDSDAGHLGLSPIAAGRRGHELGHRDGHVKKGCGPGARGRADFITNLKGPPHIASEQPAPGRFRA